MLLIADTGHYFWTSWYHRFGDIKYLYCPLFSCIRHSRSREKVFQRTCHVSMSNSITICLFLSPAL